MNPGVREAASLPLPSAPPPSGRIPASYSTSGKPTTRSQAHSWRPSSRPMNARGHLHGANLTAPAGAETRDLLAPASRTRVPRGPRSSSFSTLWVSPSTCCCLGAGQRGPTSLSLLPRRPRRSAPRPSAATLCWPRGPGNSQMGRYHPRATRGKAHRRRAPEAPAAGRVTRDSSRKALDGSDGKGTPWQ